MIPPKYYIKMKISFDQLKTSYWLIMRKKRNAENLRKTICGIEQIQAKYNFKLPNSLILRISLGKSFTFPFWVPSHVHSDDKLLLIVLSLRFNLHKFLWSQLSIRPGKQSHPYLENIWKPLMRLSIQTRKT